MNVGKFKTVLCKHFSQTGTCSYGDKCQFAHGYLELKNSSLQQNPMQQSTNQMIIPGFPYTQQQQPQQQQEVKQKSIPNPANFKIVKCKNWETVGSCKYGSVCTFAHGDNELRTKSDNNLQLSENAISRDSNLQSIQGGGINPYLMTDPSLMYNMMLQQQMMMGGGAVTPDMYSMYGMMNNPQYQGQPQMGGEINLNDPQNNMFFNQQQPQMGIPEGYGKQMMEQNMYYDPQSQGYMNMNMFMGGNNNTGN